MSARPWRERFVGAYSQEVEGCVVWAFFNEDHDLVLDAEVDRGWRWGFGVLNRRFRARLIVSHEMLWSTDAPTRMARQFGRSTRRDMRAAILGPRL